MKLLNEPKYSRVDQVKFVRDSLQKFEAISCLNICLKKVVFPILVGQFLNTLS